MDTILPSEPERNRTLLKRSLILYRDSFSIAIIFSLLLAFVVFIPRLLSDISGRNVFYAAEISPNRIWLFVIDMIAMLFSIAIYWHMHCVLRRRHEPIAEDFSRGAKKVLHVFLGTLIQSLILIAVALVIYGLIYILYQYQLIPTNSADQFTIGRTLFLMVIFIGQLFLILYVSALFIFLIPIIVIENKGVIHALEKSASLVWNHWWRTFSLQITPWICYLLILSLIRFIFGINIHLYFFPQGPHLIWTTLLNLVVFALFVPWFAAVTIVQLRDLELRRELHKKLHEAKRRYRRT